MVSRLSGSSISTRTGRFSLRSFVFLFYLFSPLFFSLVLLIFFFWGTATRRRFFFEEQNGTYSKERKGEKLSEGRRKQRKRNKRFDGDESSSSFSLFFGDFCFVFRPKTKWPAPPRIDERRPLIGRKFVAPVSAENKMADPTDDWSQICCPCFVFVSDVLLVIRPLFFHWLPAYSWGQLGTVDFLLLLLLISLENYSHDILWPLRPRKASRFSAPGYWLAGWFPGQSRAADLFCSKILAFPCCCCYSLRESSQCSGCYGA